MKPIAPIVRGTIAAALAMVLACHNYQSARVTPGQSLAGDKCFASCRNSGGTEDKVLSCVSACPGAQTADDDCQDHIRPLRTVPACVQTSQLSTPKTVVAVVAITVVGALVVGLIGISMALNRVSSE